MADTLRDDGLAAAKEQGIGSLVNHRIAIISTIIMRIATGYCDGGHGRTAIDRSRRNRVHTRWDM